MKDDNDRLLAGVLPIDPFEDVTPITYVDHSESLRPSGELPVPPYQPFPTEVLPDPILTFVTESSLAIGCDPAYTALPTLAGLAASIGNTRRIQLKRRWHEPSVLWVAIVGESGTQKSPAIELALAPIKRRQSEARKLHEKELRSYEESLDQYETTERERRKNPNLPRPTRPEKPSPWRIVCSDVTVEALAPRLQTSPRGLLLIRDELSGWIAGFDQYKKSRGADAAHWLEMHRAGDLIVDRKSGDQSIYVPRAAVSVIGGIQPNVLKHVLGREHVDNGLAARLLVAMPPRVPRRWTEDDLSSQSYDDLSQLYDRLLDLKFGTAENGDQIPMDLPLAEGGLELWVEFVNEHGLEQSYREGALAAAWSKLEAYAARLALVIHLVRCAAGDPTVREVTAVDETSVQAGAVLATWFARETERVYAHLGISSAPDPQVPLIDLIGSNGGSMSVRTLMQKTRRYRGSAPAARAALQDLVDSGVGRWQAPQGSARGGRPSELFVLFENCGDTGNGNKTPRQSRHADDVPFD